MNAPVCPSRRTFLGVAALIATLVVFLTGCEDPFSSRSSRSSNDGPPAIRTFQASRVDGSGTTYTLTAQLMAVSVYVAVYVEEGQDVTTATAEQIAAEFDREIYPVVRNAFATESDVDGNGQVILLLLDIQDGFSGSGGYVAGYFAPYHLFDYEDSNRGEILFMDTYPGVPASDTFYRTAAHEFQHLVNFVETYLRGGAEQMDLWINEGLSLSAEYLYKGTHSTDRIGYYGFSQGGWTETIRDGNNFYIWDGPEGDVLADYATAYTFFQWLRIHGSSGAGIYRRILDGPERDYTVVERLAREEIYGGSAVPFSTMIRDWYIASALNRSSGIYGFGGEFTLNLVTGAGGATSVGLLPGEGVVDGTGGSFTPGVAGSNIAYAGFTSTGDVVIDATGGTYTGNLIVAWNGNMNYGDSYSSETAPLSAAVVQLNTASSSISGTGAGVLSVTAAGDVSPKIFPIGARGMGPFSPEVVPDGR